MMVRLLYTTARRGVTRCAISRPASISVRRSSQVFCRFNQSCGDVPKYLASRNAVSALTPLWPLRIIVTRLTGTPSAFESALADSPSSSTSFLAQDLAWMHRPHPVLRVHLTLLSVIVHDLDIARPVVGPTEADTPLHVDPNAVLTGAVASQCFQPVTRQRGQVAERLRAVQQGQPAHRLIEKAVKRRDTPPLEEPSRPPVFEASYHVDSNVRPVTDSVKGCCGPPGRPPRPRHGESRGPSGAELPPGQADVFNTLWAGPRRAAKQW